MSTLALALAALLAATSPAAAGEAAAPGGAEAPAPAAGSVQASLPADSARILRDARRAQEDFERFRETRIPAELARRGGRCDEPVGRLCLMFGDGGEPQPIESAPRPVVEARRDLLVLFAEAAREIPGDAWLAGMRVHYLVEAEDLLGARQVVQTCQAAGWWCAALRGYVAQEDGEWVEAGDAFLEMLSTMPPGEAHRWTGEQWILERAGRAFLDVRDPAERERRRALVWRLSDPLFMVPGNDRWTAHMARLVQVRILEDARNPFGLEWDEDLEQILIRYGWALGWERSRQLPNMQGGQLQQNRMTARLDPYRQRFVPTADPLEAFPATGEGALEVRGRREPTGYAPAYARRWENLRTQTARFLRDDQLVVVHAFAPPAPAEAQEDVVAGDDLFGGPPPAAAGPSLPLDFRSALFLLPVEGPVVEDGPQPLQEGQALEGVWRVGVPRGDYVLSMEGWSRIESRAWRARQGLPDLPRPEGPLAASDPVFLDPGADLLPASLEEAVEQMLPRVEFSRGELLRIGWEVYGLSEGQVASVSLGLEQPERSLLRAIGEFFRVLDPVQPVTIRWDDAETERPGVVFRSVNLELPDLSPGTYDLILEISVGDEPPAVAQRRFVVTGG